MKGKEMEDKWIETNRPKLWKWIFLALTSLFSSASWFSSLLRKQMFSFLFICFTNWLANQNSLVRLAWPLHWVRLYNWIKWAHSKHRMRVNVLARDSCLPMLLLALSELLGMSGYDSLSKEVALSMTLQFMNPLPGLLYNYTQNIIRITLKIINFSIFWINTQKKPSSYCFNTK